jgi:acyl dehydratase
MEHVVSAGDVVAGVSRQVSWEKMVEFERVVWDRGATAHNSRDTARQGGIGRVFASGQNTLAFIHELLERRFGQGWVNGGKISARWVKLVYENDWITPYYQVEDIEIVGDRRRAVLKIWAENQDGEQTAIGTASAFLP